MIKDRVFDIFRELGMKANFYSRETLEHLKDNVFFVVLFWVFIGLISLLVVLFLVWAYEKIKYYRIMKTIKKGVYFIGLSLISGLIIFSIFSQLKIEKAVISNKEILIYGLIPALILVLILVLMFHWLIKLYKSVNLVKNFSWFAFDYSLIFVILMMVFYALPAENVILGSNEILIYGVLPLVILSFITLGLFKLIKSRVYRAW